MPSAATVRQPKVRTESAARTRRLPGWLRAVGRALATDGWAAGWSLPYGAAEVARERYERERRR